MKRKIIIIVGSLFLLSLIMGTVAYYVGESSSKIVVNTLNKNSININYITGDVVNVTAGLPLNNSEIEEHAFFNKFTIESNRDMDLNTRYSIVLKNISMDEELKISDFKWALFKNDEVVSSSDFSQVGNNQEIVLYDTESINSIENYELRIWLQNNNENQNNLMNKGLSAGVDVIVYVPS